MDEEIKSVRQGKTIIQMKFKSSAKNPKEWWDCTTEVLL